jgi:hypothetical protein
MNMSDFTIKLNWGMVDEIVVKQLCDSIGSLRADLGAGKSVFVWGDSEADDIEIQKHIDAFELIIKWYATPEQLADMGLTFS